MKSIKKRTNPTKKRTNSTKKRAKSTKKRIKRVKLGGNNMYYINKQNLLNYLPLKTTINNNNLEIVIITNKNFPYYEKYILESDGICDRNIISNLYEQLTLQSMEEDDVVGVFIIDGNSHIISFVVFDFKLSNIKYKLEINNNDSKTLINYNDIELTLICSNNAKKINKLTSILLKSLFNLLSELKYKNVFLWIANKQNNNKAVSFYKMLGFDYLSNNNNIMKLSL